MIWIGNIENNLWNKRKHCSQRKIEAAYIYEKKKKTKQNKKQKKKTVTSGVMGFLFSLR